MTKKNKDIYKQDHKLAKFIVAGIVSVLITIAQLADMPFSLIFNVIAVYVWLFGVNPTAYMIETVLHHKHKHDKL